MAPTRNTIQSLDDDEPDQADSKSGDKEPTPKGPPPAMPRPKQAADSSIFSTAGQAAAKQGQAGLGAEGGSTAVMGMQGMAMIQRGIQMLNLSFPDNPGLVAVLADLTGRLQLIVPQLISQQGGAGVAGMGMGLFPQPQQPPPQGPMGQPAMEGPGMSSPPMMPPMGGGQPPMGPQ